MTGRSSITAMARALGGEVSGQQVLCPGPYHSPKDRSLSVRLSSSPDGFVVFSHAGDDIGTCKDHVRSRLGWARPTRFERRNGIDDVSTSSTILCRSGRQEDVSTSPSAGPDDEAKIARARALCRETVDPRGTVVERYLASRGLALPWQATEALRFHLRCPWRDEAAGKTIFVPAMIGVMRSMETEEITGVHRTRLTPDGQKVDRRMLGKASGAAIMLAPMSSLGGGLVIGEGIETCLAAWAMGWSNVWAMGSVGAIERLPALPYFGTIVLLAETGDGGASRRAIEKVGARWHSAGREVIVVTPKVGGDLNDVIRGAA